MATVTLLQSAHMGNLAPITLFDDATDVSIVIGNNSASLRLAGNFTEISGFWTGTATQALIDSSDFGGFPEIYITELSFDFGIFYYADVIDGGNLPQLVADLLSGDDKLTGSSEDDGIFGFAGNDTMTGGGGDNLFDGGSGIDTVSYAGAGAGLLVGLEDWGANTGVAAGDTYANVEKLIGSAFSDILYGTDENNRFTGGNGNDLMVGKGGADTFDGGAGTDTVAYDASFPYFANFAIRADLLSPNRNTGDATGDVYLSVENLEGSSFDDILLGNDNPNVIRGNHYHPGPSGADQLWGRGGNDTLFGNEQNDSLIGGLGRDVMMGGAGLDDFDFNTVAEIGNNSARDVIKDFFHLSDDIDLSTIDANGAAAGNTAFSFLATKGAAFTGAPGQLRWSWSDLAGTASDKTIVAGDINGNSIADFQIELTGLKTLTAADFFL